MLACHGNFTTGLAHAGGFNRDIRFLHFDGLGSASLLKLLLFGVVQETHEIALSTFGMFRKIAGAFQKELKSPGRHVVILVAQVVEAVSNLQKSSLRIQKQ